jgi:hypothetical protein
LTKSHNERYKEIMENTTTPQTFNITVPVSTELIKSILENLPEFSMSFTVTDWDYATCTFKLRDIEDGARYTLTLEKAIEGFKKICEMIFAGELPGLEITTECLLDAGAWDSIAVDALLQVSIFGEVIYG